MTEAFERFLLANGYYQLKELPDGSVCGLYRFIFTEAIILDITLSGYGDRYCYEPETIASEQLDLYDGTTEPTGWKVKK